jgi:hypothetical protein
MTDDLSLTGEREADTGPLTVVVWEDTTNIAAWQDEDDLREFATDGGWKCKNVGWITYEDEACVVLSARLADDKEQHVGLSERIPKRAIIDRFPVEVGCRMTAGERPAYRLALETAVPVLKRASSHYDCGDCWYSCATLTCDEGRASEECDCGAAEAGRALALVEQALQNDPERAS